MTKTRLDLIKERSEGLEDYETEPDGFGEITDNPVCDRVAEYDDPVDDSYLRDERDVVISGPLSTYKGSGRRFGTEIEALHWAQDKYGFDRVSLVNKPEGAPRWAVLVKRLRNS